MMLPPRDIVAILLAVSIGCCVGCRGNGEQRVGLSSSRDPLFGQRIPRQNLPLPDRNAASREIADPLLNPPTKVAAANQEPFRLDQRTTAAALSMRGNDENDLLAIRTAKERPVESNGYPVTPVSGRADRPSPNRMEDYLAQLHRLGAKPFAPTRLRDGSYEFRCSVPITTSGTQRIYTGSGANPLAAVQDAWEQIQQDLSRR